MARTNVSGLAATDAVGDGLGYATLPGQTAVGGTATQTTNRTTGVTVDKLCGQITTDTTSLAAEATAKFTVTCARVAATDVVNVSIASGSNSGGTIVAVTATAAGSFVIAVQNNNASGGTAETGAIVINYAILKAVAS